MHAEQYVGFRGTPHITQYSRLWRRWGVRELPDAWSVLARTYDADLVASARNALREKKLDEAYAAWVEDVRGRAYVEMREPPQ